MAKLKMEMVMNKTLLVLASDSEEKCLVCDTNLVLKKWSQHAPSDYESREGDVKFGEMTVKFKKFQPFFCLLSEFEENDFSCVDKREMVKNISCKIVMDSHIVNVENRQSTQLSEKETPLSLIQKSMESSSNQINPHSLKTARKQNRTALHKTYVPFQKKNLEELENSFD
jgi:hypothetical protein